MKKKAAVLFLAVFLLAMCMAIFCACDDKSPREVEIEIINPLTGKAFEQDERIELLDEETPIEIKVKDKKKGKYLTDKDLKGIALAECLKTSVSRLWKYDYKETLNSEGNLPMEKDGVVTSNYYEIEVTFETKPSNVKEEEYKRKYEAKSQSVNFYSNKDWKGTDYFDTVLEKVGELKGEWKEFPELTIMVENTRELNDFINNSINDPYCERLKEAIQSLAEYDEEYFREKSLFIRTYLSECKMYNVAKMVINNGILTLTTVNPQYDGTSCPDVPYEGMQVISIDKKVLGDVQTIKVENIRRQTIIKTREK